MTLKELDFTAMLTESSMMSKLKLRMIVLVYGKWTQRKMLPMLSQMRLVGALIGSIMKFNLKEILSNALQRSENNYPFRVVSHH